jgi:hypothetical protein
MTPQFDTDTQLRIQRAIASGMSQDKAMRLGMMYQMQKQSAAQPTPQVAAPTQKTTTEKIAGALPLIGGIAGSFIPGLGTIIGGAAGAAAGKLLGNVAVNHDTSATNNRSALQGVGTEAVLGLAGGAAGAIAGKGVSLATRLLKPGAEAAGEVAAKGAQLTQQYGGNIAEEGVALSKKKGAEALGNKLRMGVNNPIVPGANPTWAAEKVALSNQADSVLRDLNGGKAIIGNAEKKAMAASEGYLKLNQQIDQTLADSGMTTSKKAILNAMGDAVKGNTSLETSFVKDARTGLGRFTTTDKPTQSMLRKVGSQIEKQIGSSPGGNVAISKVNALKHTLAEDSGKYWDKMARGIAPTQAEETAATLYKSLDNIIAEKVPEAKNMTLAQSVLHRATPGWQAASKVSSSLPISVVGLAAKASSGKTAGLVKDALGYSLQEYGKLPVGKFAQGIGQFAGQSGVRSLGIQGDGSQIPTDQSAVDANGMPLDQSMQDTSNVDQSTIGMPQDQTSGGTGITNEMIGALMMQDLQKTGGKHIPELQVLAKFVVPQAAKTTKLTDTAIKTVNDYQSAIKNLDQISGTLANTKVGVGPIAGRLSTINPYNTEGQSLRAQLDGVRQIIGKALEGGKLTDQDYAKYQKILPSLNDTAPVAQAKIKQLKSMLTRDLTSYVALQNSKGGGSIDITGLNSDQSTQ